MQHTTTNRRSGSYETIASAFLLVAGIVVMIASGDAFVMLVGAVVTLAVVWGMFREIGHHAHLPRSVELAPVIHLRPASSGQRDPQKTAAHASSWHGPAAA
jgi:hypothetical protein